MSEPQPKRVLIVDDSRTIRAMLRTYIGADERLECVGEAGDPYEAREMIKRTNPDVLTLDVEMPRMNGLVFLEHLMRLRPMPVVMVSNRTTENSEDAVQALSIGAVECIDLKRFRGDPRGSEKLCDTLLLAANATVGQRRPAASAPAATVSAPAARFAWNRKFVLIGSSTGGVDALEQVLDGFPPDCPPTLIAQHMPMNFLRSFARRLDASIPPRVDVLSEAAEARPGHVFLAAGGDLHAVVRGKSRVVFEPSVDDGSEAYVPSVDRLFRSAVGHAETCVAVMLTGMGRDGADAMLELKSRGAYTIVQSGRTAVVDGMPRAARDVGAACAVHDLGEIGSAVLAATTRANAGAA